VLASIPNQDMEDVVEATFYCLHALLIATSIFGLGRC